MSVPDAAPVRVTGDLDLRAKIALDDWTPAAQTTLLGRWNNPNPCYQFYVNTAGQLVLRWSANGTATVATIASTSPSGITDGATKWVRATLDVDNGASGNDVKFYTSDDGTTWTQLGTTVTTAGVTSIFAGTTPVEIGSQALGTANPAKGKFYRAQILNGIDGTVVLDADASVITLPSQTTFVDRSSNAYTVTINKSGVGTFVSTGNYLYLPGIASNFASTPDAAALDITGDLDLRLKLALDDWTPSALTYLFSKYQGAGNVSYAMSITTAGLLQLSWSVAGTTIISKTSTVAPTVTDGSTLWIRATLDVDNGAAGNDVKFFTSDDGLTWTQLGTTVTTALTTSIYAGTSVLEIGSVLNGTSNAARGKFFRAQVLNGIGGTVAFDANFENSITSLLQTSFTESSTNGATVTINRSGSAFRSAGVIDAGYFYPGATNTFANSTTDFLNFGATDSFTLMVIGRQWAAPPLTGAFLTKRDVNAGATGYSLTTVTTTIAPRFATKGTSATVVINGSVTSANGTLLNYAGVVNRSTPTQIIYTNGTNTGSITPSAESFANIDTLLLGRSSGLTPLYNDMELVGAAVFRQALTATQIRQITNYFANREVYL
jgi:hypothetical protein